MQIDYKILWLDDQIESFIEDEYIEEIKDYLSNEGFEAMIETVDNSKEFFNRLDNTYDLILTDYHMDEKGEMNGDKVVDIIRNESKVFAEILFYTARGDLKDTVKLDRISFLETNSPGVTHQRKVIEKIKSLITLTIQKFHNIVVMRGMIMNETSDMDEQKLEMIKEYINCSDIEKTNDLKYEILNEIKNHFNRKLDNVNGVWKTDDKGFSKLMKDSFVFSAEYKIKTLGWILNELSIEDFSDMYKSEIINMRNKFAHAKLIVDPTTGRKYFKHGIDGLTFDETLCRTIRENIKKHKNNLRILRERIIE